MATAKETCFHEVTIQTIYYIYIYIYIYIIIKGDYASSLLNEKKKPIRNRAQS